MVGQTKLLEKLNKYNIDNFPRSTMLIGEQGMGKHTLVNYIKDNILHLPVVDITENLNKEYIDLIYLNPNPLIYVIDFTKITEKESNAMLKLIEEPIPTSFLILLVDNRNNVLNTILNRCIIFELEQYSINELKEFTKGCKNEDLILNIVKSPGKILNSNLDSYIDELYNLCNTIVTKINKASYLNTLSITDKINYKDEYNKFDLTVFFDCLSYCYYNDFMVNGNNKSLKLYLYVSQSRKKLVDKRLNKELFVSNFLSKLWKAAK